MSADYYAMKRKAQQVLARGWNVHALLLMDDLRAWWHCADRSKPAAREILKVARRHYRILMRPAPQPGQACVCGQARLGSIDTVGIVSYNT